MFVIKLFFILIPELIIFLFVIPMIGLCHTEANLLSILTILAMSAAFFIPHFYWDYQFNKKTKKENKIQKKIKIKKVFFTVKNNLQFLKRA